MTLNVPSFLDAPLAVLAQTAAAPAEREPDYQPYIFKAYAAACALLLLFTLWAAFEERRLSRKVEYLTRRLEEARPVPAGESKRLS